MEQFNRNSLRNAVLWVLAIVALFAYASLAQAETAENLNNLSGTSGSELANFSLIMMLFAFLSLTLRGSINRLTNLVAGLVMGILSLIVLIDGLAVHFSGPYNLMMGAVVFLLFSVAWFAFKTTKA